MAFHRAYACFRDSIDVTAPPGNCIGTVDRQLSCKPIFAVRNCRGEMLYRIKGPACAVTCCVGVDFYVS